MTSPTTRPVERERGFLFDELFFSTTDRKGIITSSNEVFVRISGFKREELIAKPHNIIRHPDMPRAVFGLLWDYILAGKPIAAYVKNMAKTGEYYWVLALVFPIDEGFLSIRVKPNTPLFETVKGLYEELLKFEKQQEEENVPRKTIIAKSLAITLEKLKGLGFQDYDSFMRTALLEELNNRGKVTKNTVSKLGVEDPWLSKFRRIEGDLNLLFGSLGNYVTLAEVMKECAGSVTNSSTSLQELALNASIQASHLGDEGATLAVLADRLGALSRDLAAFAKILGERTIELRGSMNELVFSVSGAWLMLELIRFYRNEVIAGKSLDVVIRNENERNLALLLSVLAREIESSSRHVNTLKENLGSFGLQAKELFKLFLSVNFIYVLGQVESSKLRGTTSFASLFTSVVDGAGKARASLDELMRNLDKVASVSFDGTSITKVIGQLTSAPAASERVPTQEGSPQVSEN